MKTKNYIKVMAVALIGYFVWTASASAQVILEDAKAYYLSADSKPESFLNNLAKSNLMYKGVSYAKSYQDIPYSLEGVAKHHAAVMEMLADYFTHFTEVMNQLPENHKSELLAWTNEILAEFPSTGSYTRSDVYRFQNNVEEFRLGIIGAIDLVLGNTQKEL